MGKVDAAPGTFAARVARALENRDQKQALRDYQDEIQPYARQLTTDGLPQWDAWRDQVRDVRAHTIRNLDRYLAEFAGNVVRRGGRVFVAATAAEATAYIVNVARAHGVGLAVKSKTMLGEEIGLNAALEAAGVQVVETDLGEYIIQLAGERPAHITGPCIHMSLEDVRALFSRFAGRELAPEPEALTAYARTQLRGQFLSADMGISGCNFGVASSGSLVLVTNEGNGRMVTSIPPVHVAVMGMERLVPDWRSLDAVLTALPRAGVCGPSTAYVTAITGPRRVDEVDGPSEMHVVIVHTAVPLCWARRTRVRCAAYAAGPASTTVRSGATSVGRPTALLTAGRSAPCSPRCWAQARGRSFRSHRRSAGPARRSALRASRSQTCCSACAAMSYGAFRSPPDGGLACARSVPRRSDRGPSALRRAPPGWHAGWRAARPCWRTSPGHSPPG